MANYQYELLFLFLVAGANSIHGYLSGFEEGYQELGGWKMQGFCNLTGKIIVQLFKVIQAITVMRIQHVNNLKWLFVYFRVGPFALCKGKDKLSLEPIRCNERL